jgi:eukaryotic-like serine/threonine-protein kinase
MQFWNELEGQTIDRLYPLRRLVRSEGRSAWFETATGEELGTPATISLTEALTDADEVTARLKAAQTLKHPNLVSITTVGQASLDNTLIVYAVMEHIEQSLSDVLQTQALTAEEGREVAEALVGALTAIHQKGMSHGHVEAASVLATEETVKLRSDCLQTNTAGQAEDIAGIGTTLFHAFTQRKAPTATDAQINRIPAPFAEIIRNSFARRWTLAQIANALKPGQPGAQAIPPAPTPGRTAPPASVRTAAPASVRTAAPASAPPAPPVPPPAIPPHEPIVVKVVDKTTPSYRPATPPTAAEKPRSSATEEEEPVAAQRKPVLLYGALAVLVLAIIGWLFWPKPAQAPTNVTNPQTAAQPAPPPPAAVPTPAAPPAKPAAVKKPAPAKSPADRQTASATAPKERTIWRVVVYTYRSQKLAADKASQITDKYPDLSASVFNPAGKSDTYLVIVGGAMDREHSFDMRAEALRDGMPADTYARNFSQ